MVIPGHLVSGVNTKASCKATPKFSVWALWCFRHCEFSYIYSHIKKADEPHFIYFPQKLKALVCARQVGKNELFPLGVKKKIPSAEIKKVPKKKVKLITSLYLHHVSFLYLTLSFPVMKRNQKEQETDAAITGESTELLIKWRGETVGRKYFSKPFRSITTTQVSFQSPLNSQQWLQLSASFVKIIFSINFQLL